MAEGDTLVNAIIGAVVSIVLAMLPFSPLLGGMVAGYLEGGARGDGLRVGAISGLIVMLPVVGIAMLVAWFATFWFLGGFPMHLGALGVLFVLAFVLVFVGVYTVGLSALGGWLGNYVKVDTDVGSSE